MNEDDLTKNDIKNVKPSKVAKTKAKTETTVEVKAQKVPGKKAETADKIPAKTKTKTETTASVKAHGTAGKKSGTSAGKAPETVADMKSAAKTKARTAAAKTKESVTASAKVDTLAKAKSAKARSKEEAASKTEAALTGTGNKETGRKPKTAGTKKAVESGLPETLPLAAKIQTQENFDLTETEIDDKLLSPVFKALAEPKLPELREENRAFLQIQSPTRIFFYWSLKQDSFNTLRRALGNRANDYFLAIRLTNLNTSQDEIHQVGNRGSWWFNNIESDSKYRAEVGFFAHGRPFVRIVFSNTLVTPRQKPSENAAYQPYFAVTSDKFAEVLDLAGFSQDAFDVYFQGDEPESADKATQQALTYLTGNGQIDFSNVDLNELRQVLFALASGASLFGLREQVSGGLFEFLAALTDENPDSLTEEKVILALEEFFGFSPFEAEIEEDVQAPKVFGASLINFPKQLRRKNLRFSPDRSKEGKIAPLSSFSLR